MRYRHLPPGREPGLQSRRRKSSIRRSWHCFLLVLGSYLFVWEPIELFNGKIAPFIGLGSWADNMEDTELIVVAALAFPVAVVVLLIYLSDPIPKAGGLALLSHPQSPKSGGIITINSKSASAERVPVVSFQASLICVEIYDEYARMIGKDWRYRSSVVTEIYRATSTGSGDDVGCLAVPTSQPCSYEGKCLSYAWRIEFVSNDSSGKTRKGSLPIWVVP